MRSLGIRALACLLDTEQLPPTLSTQYRPAEGDPGDRSMQEPSDKAQISAVVCAHVVSGARQTPCMGQNWTGSVIHEVIHVSVSPTSIEVAHVDLKSFK